MALLDFILNLAAILLWLNWRYLRLARSLGTPRGVSLAGTLRSTQAPKTPTWPYLAGLGALLLVRAVAYSTIGSNLKANMVLDLGLVPIYFNPRFLWWMLVFSLLSFIVFFGVFYFWLLLLSILNHREVEPDVCLRWIRAHLGWVERRPVWFKALIPGFAAVFFWLLAGLMLESMGLFPHSSGAAPRLVRALCLGAYAYLTWVPVLIALALLHILTSYVYFGEAAFWTFVQRSGKALLAPFEGIRLQLLRMDLTPLVLVAVLWWISWPGCFGRLCGGCHGLMEIWNRFR